MTKALNLADIEWAYTIQIGSDVSVVKAFINNLLLFVGEIIRSDEIGLIVWGQTPIFMVRIYKIDFDTKKTHVEMINFEGSGFKNMLTTLGLTSQSPPLICSGFEIFCYRPKLESPYHPKMHPTYNRAREKASRILDTIFIVVGVEGVNTTLSYTKVNTKASIKFFEKTSKNDKYIEEVTNLMALTDCWMGEFYSKEIDSKQYKTKNRYPLSPKPLENCQLSIITSDDNGNLISYSINV